MEEHLDYLVVSHLNRTMPEASKNLQINIRKPRSWQVQKLLQMLPQFFEIADLADRAVAVKEGEELSLGSHTLQFFMVPMVHWPEVMVEYEKSGEDSVPQQMDLVNLVRWMQMRTGLVEARRYYSIS